MKTKRQRLAIIPARGGSQRIKNKNIKNFHGRPIIHYSLEYAEKSNLFDKIHVSTDSYTIKKCVEKFGIEIDFKRPKELSDEHTTLFDVLKFTVSEYARLGQRFDEIWLIMACAPLTRIIDLKKASLTFNPNKGVMVAVAEMPVPVEWCYVKSEFGLLEFVKPESYQFRSQDLGSSYFDAGAFAIFTENQLQQEKFIASPIQPYHLPKYRAVDIDTEEDWMFAEALYEISQSLED